jgi:hypothetical protein
LTIIGAGTWNKEAPIPEASKRITISETLGIMPIKLIIIADSAGIAISTYRIGKLSEKYPTTGLNSDGSLCTTVRKLTNESERENFSINKGNIGARNDV